MAPGHVTASPGSGGRGLGEDGVQGGIGHRAGGDRNHLVAAAGQEAQAAVRGAVELGPATVTPRFPRLDPEVGPFQAADAAQGVCGQGHLLAQLLRVVQVLPIAAAAAAGHGAGRLHALGGGRQHGLDLGAGVVLAGFHQARPHAFAGKGPGHEDHLALVSGQAFAAGHQLFDLEFEQGGGRLGWDGGRGHSHPTR